MNNLGKLIAGLLAGTAVVPAAAQESAPPAAQAEPTTQAQSTGTGIQDIVVTAQRRGENLQDVPISISAVTAETLEAAGIASTTDIMRVAPGLQFQQAVGLAAPYIRGLGISNQQVGVESSVATYVDGVYLATGGDALLSLNNVDRIEVLRGPQGTLFGRNATGGLIHIITRTPQYTPEMEASLSFDQWETVTAAAYVTGGLSSTVAADLALRYSHQGQGWGINRRSREEVNKVDHDFSARGKLLFEPGDTTRIVVAGDYSDIRASTYLTFTPVPGHAAIPTNPATPTQPTLFTGNPWDSISWIDDPFRESENWGVSGDLTQELGFANLRSITAYRSTDFSGKFDPGSLPIPTVTIYPHIENKQFSQELQLLSPGESSINWIVGLYYFRNNSDGSTQNIDLYRPVTFAPGPIFRRQNVEHKVSSLAGFAQATVPITSQLRATAGLRLTQDKFTYFNNTVTDLTFVPKPFNLLMNSSTRKGKQTKPGWRFALDYQAGSDALFYASYTRGFKSGGFDVYRFDGPILKPELVDSYEVGTKLDALDRALRFNASVYYYTAKNLQIALLDNGTANLRNAAGSEAYGAEVEITAVPVTGLTLTAAGSYLHSRFTDFNGNAPVSTALPGGGNVINPFGSATGNHTARAPAKTVTLSANYETQLAGGKLGLNASGFWSSKWYADPDNRLFQPAYELLSGEISWTEPSGHVRFRIFGRNLTNSEVTAQFGSLITGDVRSLTEPRTIGAGVGFKF